MTKTTAASLALLIGAGVGLAIGVKILRGKAIPPQSWFIDVGPSAKDVSGPEKAPMSRANGHTIAWKSTRDWPLTIYFLKSHLPKDDENQQRRPFKSMIDMGDRWVVKPLSGGTPAWRYSGPINDELKISDTTKLEFKYWQILNGPTTGKDDEADGRIIIKK